MFFPLFAIDYKTTGMFYAWFFAEWSAFSGEGLKLLKSSI